MRFLILIAIATALLALAVEAQERLESRGVADQKSIAMPFFSQSP